MPSTKFKCHSVTKMDANGVSGREFLYQAELHEVNPDKNEFHRVLGKLTIGTLREYFKPRSIYLVDITEEKDS